jgi:hypothetical protein
VRPEEVLAGDGRGLGAIVYAEFGVEAAELGFDGVVADVEVLRELVVGHARREQYQQLAFSYSETGVSAWPAELRVDRGALCSSVDDNALAPGCGADAVDDLGAAHCFGDEPGRAGLEDASHKSRVVGETEHDDGAGPGIRDKAPDALFGVSRSP